MSELILNSQHFKHNLHLINSHINPQSCQDSKNAESKRADSCLDSHLDSKRTESCVDSHKVELALVLKDNAYGHGLEQMAQLAAMNGVKSVFVKNYDEAMRIRDYFPSITAFYGMPAGDFPPHIAFVINHFDHITTLPRGTKVELKVNAGMNRNGIESSELESYIRAILAHGLELVGVFSHNGYGDDVDENFALTQRNFAAIKAQVRELSKILHFPLPRFHSLSSSGAVRVANEGGIDDDLVRIGIAAYGYLEAAFSEVLSPRLKKVAALYADRVSTRTLRAGERIGYSGCTRLDRECVVSTYDIGYGDGFFRVAEGREVFTASGLKILPRSSMDCFSCVCDEPRICVFDDVTPIARAFGTISYEILTHLSPFIRRTII